MLRVIHKKIWCIAAILFCIAAFIGCDYLVSHKRHILYGIPFSGTYADCNGTLLHIYLTPDQNYRVYKPIEEYPMSFIQALLLQEDKRFYSHCGINPVALVRAATETYIHHSRRIGASTITMQTAKLKYHLYTKTIRGKLLQIFLALRLEFLYSKQEILDAYVNLVPCGKNIEGFETAARYYFAKGIEQLNISEQLLLCVIPQNPAARTPSLASVPQALLDARQRLFEQWIAVNPQDTDLQTFISLPPDLTCRFPDHAPHFTRMIEQKRQSQQGNNPARPQGVIPTTLDTTLQNLCSYRIQQYLRQNHHLGVQNAAVLLLDYTTMHILADIGSAGFYNDSIQGQVDANISKRSPGSTLKPFIYALALQQGIIHYATMLKDTPSSFSEYTPDNYNSIYKGPIKAWSALTESRNIPAITLARQIHEPDLYDFLIRGGIQGLKPKDTYGLSIVLGSAEVTPFELVTLYAALANDGLEQHVRIAEDNTLSDACGMPYFTPHELFSKESAFIVRTMLEQNPPPDTRPTGNKDTSVAFKTGTSIGFKDCWTVGIFDRYVLCVWIGNFDGLGNNAFIGRSLATPLFFTIADSILATIPYKDRIVPKPAPKTVKQIPVCSVSGYLPGPHCPHTELAWFIPGVSPITTCRIHRSIAIDTRSGYRTDDLDNPYTKQVVREFWPSDLLALFEQAGLPRLTPPDYPPKEHRLDTSLVGYPPQIISPLRYTKYVFRSQDTSKNVLILSAAADADTDELFWFNGTTFITRTKPGEKYEWRPQPGTYELTVCDTKGRSSAINVNIQMER
ncbi:MAG: penicillin-binding protein 1C [Treponema sp.]|nr:penicillin-binding protein 1C [Treponema sp.]